MPTLIKFAIVFVLALVISATAPLIVWADGGDASLVHACVMNRGGHDSRRGDVRIVGPNEACRRNEAAVHWGVAGPQGPQGLPGPQGPAGPPGAAGATDAFATFRELGDGRGPVALPRGLFVTVGRLELPAGRYVVIASLFFVNDSTTDQALAYCLLQIGARNAQAIETVPPQVGGVGAAVSQALTVADQLFAPGFATLSCTNNNGLGGDLSISTFNINAINVGTLTFQP